MGFVVEVDAKEAKEAVAGFPLLPAGKYIARVVDVQKGKFKTIKEGAKPPALNAGREKYVVRFKIIEGEEGVGRQFTDFNIPLFTKWAPQPGEEPKTAAQFYKFFGALGVDFSEGGAIEVPDPIDILKQEIGIDLTIEDDYKDRDKQVNKINGFGYFPASDGLPEPKVADDEFNLDD